MLTAEDEQRQQNVPVCRNKEAGFMYLYPQNSTFGLGDNSQDPDLNDNGNYAYFFINIHLRAFPTVWDSSTILKVAADRSGAAPLSWERVRASLGYIC